MKNKNLICASAIAATILLASCGQEGQKGIDIDAMVEYIPVQTQPDGRWGLMSVDGRLLFEDEFTSRPTLTINGAFSVGEDGGVSIYTPGEQPHLLGQCEGLTDVGFCNESRIPVARNNSRISVVNSEGETVFTLSPINGHEIVGCGRYYNDGRLVITDDQGLYGSVDIEGQTVVAPKYDYLSNYNEGFAIALQPKPSAQYIVVDPQDQKVCEVKKGYTVVSHSVKGGEIVVKDSTGILSFMNMAGDVQHLPAKVKNVGEYNQRIFAFCDTNHRWGIMSRAEGHQILMRPKFTSLSLLRHDDQMLVNLDDRWSVMDLHGKKAIAFDDSYKSVIYTPLKGSIRYMARDNAGWVMLDAEGKELAADFNIYDFSFEPTLENGQISSRLFDLEAFEKRIISLITENSLAGIQLNAIANPWYADQNASDFVDKSEFTPTQLPKGDFGYEINVVGVTDRVITMLRYNRAEDNYDRVFVPNNTVYAIELIITTTVDDIYGKSLDYMVKALEEMGYRLVESESDSATLRSRYANIELSALENEEGLSVLMYKL